MVNTARNVNTSTVGEGGTMTFQVATADCYSYGLRGSWSGAGQAGPGTRRRHGLPASRQVKEKLTRYINK